MEEILDDILDYFAENNIPINGQEITSFLFENGFMIVPIEDPTNLRYGIDD